MSRVIGAAPYRMATTSDVRLFRFLRPVLHQVACCSSSRRRSRSAMNSACIPSYSRSPASVCVVLCPKRRRVSMRLRCVWRNTSERAIRSSARARSLGRSRVIAITLPNGDDCGCRTSARLPVTLGASGNGQKAAGAHDRRSAEVAPSRDGEVACSSSSQTQSVGSVSRCLSRTCCGTIMVSTPAAQALPAAHAAVGGSLGWRDNDLAAHNEYEAEVAGRFGMLPNFFRSAQAAPELIQQLWGFAKTGYLDNPMPSVFKERLFVWLSRFCGSGARRGNCPRLRSWI